MGRLAGIFVLCRSLTPQYGNVLCRKYFTELPFYFDFCSIELFIKLVTATKEEKLRSNFVKSDNHLTNMNKVLFSQLQIKDIKHNAKHKYDDDA